MVKAIQVLKLTIGSLVLAAVIGLYGFNKNDNTTSFDDNAVDSVIVVKQEPQIEIQKQQASEIIHPTDSREKYIVRSGDNMFKISTKFRHEHVLLGDYQKVLIKINSGHKLQIGQKVLLPNEKDLKNVIMPEVKILFSIHDEDFITDLKHSEGSSKIQSSVTRQLVNGRGKPFKNNKFYPYRDSNGNFTIGYGHYLGKDPNNAYKYKNGITKSYAHKLLRKDMKRIYSDYVTLLRVKRATELSVFQQKVLFEMAFTMGVDKLAKFNNMWKHSNNEELFVKEIRNSLWYRQVGDRAERILNASI